jgi:hypothetical protein
VWCFGTPKRVLTPALSARGSLPRRPGGRRLAEFIRPGTWGGEGASHERPPSMSDGVGISTA